MHKIFTLAIAVAVMPLSQNFTRVNFSANNKVETPDYLFPYKNTLTQNLFAPEKKPTEAWSQNWQATMQENIRKSEYHIKWQEKSGAYSTPNRKNNLRFFMMIKVL